MKPGIPWSVKGIEPEVREAAKHAARRAGMTLGEWLNTVILENETGAPGEGANPSAPPSAQPYAEAVPAEDAPPARLAARRNEGSVRLEDIAQQLSKLAQRERESATIQPYERPQAAAADRDQLDRILYRMDRSEQQTVEAFTAMNERLSVLGQQIASQPKPKTFEKAEDVPGYSALDNAIRNVIGHIEVSEKRTRESLKSMQDRLSEMAERATRPSNPDELLKSAPAFNSLETRFAELSNRIQRSENLLHAGLPDLVKKEINQLADRIENVRASTEAAARQAETEAVKVARGELRDIESRILGVLKEAQQLIGSQHTTGADLQKVRAEIGGLNRRIDDVKAQTASEHDVHALRVAVEQLSTRVAQGPDMRPLAEMDRRIGELSRKIDQHQPDLRPVHAKIDSRFAELNDRIAQVQPDLRPFAAEVDKKLAELSAKIDRHQPDMRPFAAEIDRRISDLARKVEQGTSAVRSLPQFGELEKRIAELDHRLGEAMRLQGDHQAVQRLEEHIAAVNDRVARTEEQLGHLETMESAIRQLYGSLEQNRETAGQAAEEAANRALERFVAMQPANTGSSPELEALEQGLRAVRESALGAEQRNQETLEAVHETLEQIVSKLAELETSAAGHQVAAAMAQQASERVVEQVTAQQQAASSQHMPKPAAAPATQAFFDPSGVFEAPAFTAPPAAAPVMPELAAEPAHASAPMMPDFAAGAAGAAMPDDFIAAARRAAQAAATRPAAPAAPDQKPEAAEKPAKASKLKLPQFAMPSFLKGSKKLPEPIVFVNGKPVMDPGVAANSNSAQRRKLVLIGIVLLTAVSAFAFTMVAKTKPAKQTSSIEQVMPQVPTDEPAQMSGDPAATGDREPAPATASLPAYPPSTGLADAPSADPMATGSLPARKTDATLSSIVSEPSEGRAEMPPADTGTEALRQAAAMGDAKAQFIIASRYLDGLGVAQDLPKAAHWYQLSAQRGLAPAQYRLATLFERGKGVPQDIATALLWYERAAEGGNIKAMHNAAVIAAGNQAGTPNYDKAFRWFKAAAERGLHDSQFNLAVLNERGLGTKVDPAEALFWYTLAGNQGDQDAVMRATKIAKTLTGDQAAQITAKANAFQPIAQNDAGNVVSVSDPAWDASPETASTTPADAVAEPAAPSPAAMLEPGEPAQPMMDSNASATAPATPVAEAQALLSKLGYNVGTPDGRMGSRTANAIRLFQLQSGLKVTGEVTPEVIEAMRAKAG